jgi:hypothetical protein
MTEVTTAATKSNTANPAARAFGPSNYEIPKSGLPSMGTPEALRETAEKGVAQAKDTYEKAKVAAEEATDLKDTYATAAKAVGRQNHNPSRSCVRRRRYQHPIPPCWMAATAACDTALPNAGNGDFGTSPIYGQLSDKPLLAFIELRGVPNANHNSGSRS